MVYIYLGILLYNPSEEKARTSKKSVDASEEFGMLTLNTKLQKRKAGEWLFAVNLIEEQGRDTKLDGTSATEF